ncbi:MAG: TrkA C-terminal domain-containing protein [Candidatus Halalkalibacterium sp. M3_1C_030]
MPHGNTVLEPGDELSIIGQPQDIKTLMDNKLDT